MGISVSSTRTHERLVEKRALRKMKRYQSNDPIRMPASPLGAYEHNNDLAKPTLKDSSKLHEINNVENLEITLKTTDRKYKDYQKLSTPRDEPSQLYLKKDNIRQTSPSHPNQPLTIKHNKMIDTQVSGPSSMQEIDLAPTKLNHHLQINPHQGINSINSINSNKQATSNSQRNISLQKEHHGNQNEEMEKEVQREKEKRKIEQTKKYIESSSYPHKGNLTNAVYQQKSSTKIESILTNSPIRPSKMPEAKQIPQVTTIKLKTEEEYFDEIKRSDRQNGTGQRGNFTNDNKDNISGNKSLGTLNKKF